MEPTPVGHTLPSVAADLIGRWLSQRGDQRTVDQYLVDGAAGKLTGSEKAPYEMILTITKKG